MGVYLAETIDLQNGLLALLPPSTPANQIEHLYIHSGRALAEMVHNDGVYQFFYQTAFILNSLGAIANPGLPAYPNQAGFVTCFAMPAIVTAIGEVTELALNYAWYWKYQQYRRLRPEEYALWVNDVKTGLVQNQNNFDLTDFLLNSQILNDIRTINNEWISGTNSYTLPQSFREGCPAHPSYPSGHAVISGACGTILKMFYNGDQTWLSLPGVIANSSTIFQADQTGINLVAYTKTDVANMTVGTEINKLCSNMANGRDWAGIHYRSDWLQGMALGEEIAKNYMQDILCSIVEKNINGSNPIIHFRKFDGTNGHVTCRNCSN